MFSPTLLITIEVIITFPILVNITYIVVCFKTLRKKLHNLLVLSLCISDSFLAVSLEGYIMSVLINSLKNQINLCLWNTFAVGYGLMSSYSLILVICLERYVTVKSMNFGALWTLDRFKYLIIGGTLALGFMFTIETILFTPHVTVMSSCSVPNLYGNQYHFFVILFFGALTTILISIIFVTLSTSYHIWRLFFAKNKIHTTDHEYNTDTQQNETTDKGENSKNINKINIWEDNALVTSSENTHICRKTDDDDDVENESDTRIVSDANFAENTTYQQNISKAENDGEMKGNISLQQLIMQLKQERLYSLTSNNADIRMNNYERPKKPFTLNAWEFRAFTTSIFIGLSSMCLTGPFVISYWVDVHTGTLLPQQTRFLLLIPVMINSLINPFIYAWRIPEIRQEFRKLFCKFNS